MQKRPPRFADRVALVPMPLGAVVKAYTSELGAAASAHRPLVLLEGLGYCVWSNCKAASK